MLLEFKSKFKMNGHDFSACQNLKMATTLTPFFSSPILDHATQN